MGSNSNRSLTKEERLAGYAKEVLNTRDTSTSEFQCNTGARIRGELGIEKGNEFISAMNKCK